MPSCTAANLEEEMFNLVAHHEYQIIEDWRALSVEDELQLRDKGLNRVTDTCIPETVMRHIEGRLMSRWKIAAENNLQRMPIDFMFDLLDAQRLKNTIKSRLKIVGSSRKGHPGLHPGFEDSTLKYLLRMIDGSLPGHGAIARNRSNGETRTLVPIDLRSITHWLLSNRRNRGRFSHLRGPDAGARSPERIPPLELLLSNQ